MKTLLMLIVALLLSACTSDFEDQLLLNAKYCLSDTECEQAFADSVYYAKSQCKSHKRDAPAIPIIGFDNLYDCSDFSVI